MLGQYMTEFKGGRGVPHCLSLYIWEEGLLETTQEGHNLIRELTWGKFRYA